MSHSLHWHYVHYGQTDAGSVEAHDSDHASREWFSRARQQTLYQAPRELPAPRLQQMRTLWPCCCHEMRMMLGGWMECEEGKNATGDVGALTRWQLRRCLRVSWLLPAWITCRRSAVSKVKTGVDLDCQQQILTLLSLKRRQQQMVLLLACDGLRCVEGQS